MLKDIDVIKIPFEFNGEQRYLRYNMNSRLYLEYMCETPDLLKKNTKLWTFDDVLHMFRAMLMDSYYCENKEFIEQREFHKVKPTLSEIGRYIDEYGTQTLMQTMLKGIVSFFPEAPKGASASENPLQAM